MSEELQDTGIEPAQAAEPTEPATVETPEAIEEPGTEPAAPPKGVQKRLDELTRIRRDAERDRDYWREMAMRQNQPAPQQTAVPQEAAPPKVEDFEDYNEYLRASARHEVKQELQQERQREEQQRRQQEAIRTQQTQQQRVLSVTEKGRSLHVDFDDVVVKNTNLPLSEIVVNAAAESEAGHEILYYLGKNPAEADRIAKLTPYGQAVEIGRLEAKLSAPKPKPMTSAPAPINPVGSKSGAGIEPDSSKDPDGWLAWERARVKALGRKY